MARNTAFGRPRAQDRLRQWWYARDPRVRVNTLLILEVGGAVVALLLAATSKDASRRTPLANATRPNLTPNTVVIATSTSTTVPGELVAAGVATKPTDLFGLSSTTTSTVAVAATVPAPAPARASTPATTTTLRPTATTITNPDVVFSEGPTTTTPPTTTPVATTAPPTTSPPTTATTTPPPTTTPTTVAGLPLPLGLSPLLGP
jgi:hypothetical protein